MVPPEKDEVSLHWESSVTIHQKEKKIEVAHMYISKLFDHLPHTHNVDLYLNLNLDLDLDIHLFPNIDVCLDRKVRGLD